MLTAVLWVASAASLLAVAFWHFFGGTYFSQDDFVWLCFARFGSEPLSVLWRDTLAQQFFRPMGLLWYMAVFRFAENDVHAYQVFFLLTHVLNGCLAGWLASRLIHRSLGPYVWLVFTLNAVFVTGVSIHYFFIFDTLGCAFYLLSLSCLHLAQSRRPVLYGALSLLGALASYLTKEAYFTLPLAALLVLGAINGGLWSWSAVRRRWRWLVFHLIVWGAAISWRTAIIHGVGGYGLASIDSFGALVDHLTKRAGTWLGFAGWSLLPALARPSATDHAILFPSAIVLASLTCVAWLTRKNRPWVVWSWCWMVITWAPSLTMTTYAPVSWYTPALGAGILCFLGFHEQSWAKAVGLTLGLYLSIHASSFFSDREPTILFLVAQLKDLEQRFPGGGWAQPPHSSCILFDLSLDLYPDPVVKFHTPPESPMADVLFLNPRDPVMWVVTNDSQPTDLAPLAISEIYQRGYVDMGRCRAYPLQRAPRADTDPSVLKRRVIPFRWDQGRFVEGAFRREGP
jgi:hypothetical protein